MGVICLLLGWALDVQQLPRLPFSAQKGTDNQQAWRGTLLLIMRVPLLCISPNLSTVGCDLCTAEQLFEV